MSTFKLTIASPDGSKYEGDAEGIIVRGVEGDLQVLAGHVPFVTSLKPCPVVLHLPDGSTRTGRAEGGLLTVSKEHVTLLSSSFSWNEAEA